MNPDCGIYAIVSPSGKKYIGQTASFKKRWREHRNALNRGDHRCRPLQRAWNKYGAERMVFIVLEVVAVENLNAHEQAQFNAHTDAGLWPLLYNTSFCAEAPRRGSTNSPEAVAKSVAAKKANGTTGKGVPHSPEHIAAMKAALPNGSKHHAARRVECSNGMTFDAMKAAADWLRENGHPRAWASKISACCHGGKFRKTAYGYAWRFVSSDVSTA
jgi:group I intron endonuclease